VVTADGIGEKERKIYHPITKALAYGEIGVESMSMFQSSGIYKCMFVEFTPGSQDSHASNVPIDSSSKSETEHQQTGGREAEMAIDMM
jgi:hypothetical protein